MKRAGKPWCRRLLVLLIVPPALWAAVLALVPTEWAKARVLARLRQETGRSVRLGALRLGPLGGVRLVDLEIGEPKPNAPPWLRVQDLRINLNLFHLLVGTLEPTRIEAVGVTARLLRRSDGSLEFGDLLRVAPRPESLSPQRAQPTAAIRSTPPVESPPGTGPGELQFQVRRGRISLVDEPSGSHIEIQDIEGHGTWRRRLATIDDLIGKINGGQFRLAAQLDRGATPGPSFDGRLRAREVALGEGMNALEYLVPILAGIPTPLEGRLDLDLYLRGQGSTASEVRRSLEGQGMLVLDPIRLDDSRLVSELTALVPLPASGRLASVRSDLTIRNERVGSRNLNLTLGSTPIVLEGWTDFDGGLDYRIKAEGLTGQISPEIQNLLADLPLELRRLLDLRLQGTFAAPLVTLDGVPLNRTNAAAHRRAFTRQLRDRLLR